MKGCGIAAIFMVAEALFLLIQQPRMRRLKRGAVHPTMVAVTLAVGVIWLFVAAAQYFVQSAFVLCIMVVASLLLLGTALFPTTRTYRYGMCLFGVGSLLLVEAARYLQRLAGEPVVEQAMSAWPTPFGWGVLHTVMVAGVLITLAGTVRSGPKVPKAAA